MDENARERSKRVEDETQEREHFKRIVNAFRYYRNHSMQRLNKSESYLRNLPKHHQILLSKYSHQLENVRVAIEHNYEIIKLIVKDVTKLFENVDHTEKGEEEDKDNGEKTRIHSTFKATNMDMEKVQSTLKQFVRDWSEEGAEERKACYDPILEEIEKRFPANECDRRLINVLVPGAGLGRLAHEIAKRGFTCQGNEFSLFMLFASNFVLNKCHEINIYRLYPWVHHYSNNLQAQDQVRYVLFPDVDPSELSPDAQFSIAAGDFVQVYTESDTWDCIATCFFLDTACNVVSYIETIWKILKPGGYWINLGPLLYHFADVANENSIEPSYEDLIGIVKKLGFDLLKENLNVPTTYSQNPFSMLRYEYRSVFFICQKPKENIGHPSR